jgi:hypothetical protein
MFCSVFISLSLASITSLCVTDPPSAAAVQSVVGVQHLIEPAPGKLGIPWKEEAEKFGSSPISGKRLRGLLLDPGTDRLEAGQGERWVELPEQTGGFGAKGNPVKGVRDLFCPQMDRLEQIEDLFAPPIVHLILPRARLSGEACGPRSRCSRESQGRFCCFCRFHCTTPAEQCQSPNPTGPQDPMSNGLSKDAMMQEPQARG